MSDSFNRFLRLPENALALNAIRRLARGVILRRRCVPLVLHGPTGCGKTHLATAFEERIRRDRPSATVIRLAVTDWSREFQNDPSGRLALIQTYSQCDALVLEDLQHAKEEMAETIGTLLDARLTRGTITLLTANVGPSGLDFPKRLIGRLIGGLVCAIAPYSERSSRRLARRFLEASSLKVEPGVVDWLSTVGSPRAMSGEILRLEQLATFLPSPIRLDDVMDHLGHEGDDQPVTNTLSRITERVAERSQLNEKILRGPSRTRQVVQARQVAMYLARQAGATLIEIGRFFGNRDHSSVLHSIDRVLVRVGEDETLRREIRDLTVQSGRTRTG